MGAHEKSSPPHFSGSTAAKRTSSASSDALSSALRLVKSGGSGSRYLWTDDSEKSRCLISIVTMALAKKPAGARRNIRSGEWAQLMDAFNTEAPEPVDCIKVLQNRLVTLRTNCREYHEVATAKDVEALMKEKPALRKWQKRPFEFYDEMAGCMKLMGDRLMGQVRGGDNNSRSVHEEEDEVDAEEEGSPEKSESEGEDGAPLPANAKRGRQDEDDDENDANDGRRRQDAASEASTTPSNASIRQKRLRRESSCPDAVTSTAELSLYATALKQLEVLQLPLAERVDAKRFLVDAGNAQAFVYMDEEEQRYFLATYARPERGDVAQ